MDVGDLKYQLSVAWDWYRQEGKKINRLFFCRLEAYDRNENFQEDPVLLPEPLDAGWPVTGYKQVLPEHKSLLPKITREQIEAYFLYRLEGRPIYLSTFLTLAAMLHLSVEKCLVFLFLLQYVVLIN